MVKGEDELLLVGGLVSPETPHNQTQVERKTATTLENIYIQRHKNIWDSFLS